jgi:hypothetical protein
MTIFTSFRVNHLVPQQILNRTAASAFGGALQTAARRSKPEATNNFTARRKLRQNHHGR